MKYLLDTNQVVFYLRNNRAVVQGLQSLRSDGLAISVISVAELYEGIFRASDTNAAETALSDFLSDISILGIDDGVCRVFGQERARLRMLGTLLSDLDLLIAATSLYYGLVLATNDKAFDCLEGLQLSDLKP